MPTVTGKPGKAQRISRRQAKKQIEELLENAQLAVVAGRWEDAFLYSRQASATAKAATVETPANGTIVIKTVGERDDGIDPDPRYSQSLERGLKIWACFTAEQPMWRLADIADRLGFARSTTHRYLITLEAFGLVESTVGHKYRLVA